MIYGFVKPHTSRSFDENNITGFYFVLERNVEGILGRKVGDREAITGHVCGMLADAKEHMDTRINGLGNNGVMRVTAVTAKFPHVSEYQQFSARITFHAFQCVGHPIGVGVVAVVEKHCPLERVSDHAVWGSLVFGNAFVDFVVTEPKVAAHGKAE